MAHACPYTVTVGAYLLGVLCARESTEFHRHAEVCPDCEREIAELTSSGRTVRTSSGQRPPTPGTCRNTAPGWRVRSNRGRCVQPST
ncbi:Putative zinc-finger [Kibdelosporangium aridum]|uniref:Putative zinc-finger n=1 Tax=Kibdelosporangium aridum TaxID=2030 RepID=A0A1Y5YBL6_KIBAR|nr:Putative zinc-finger [Kibdelosporangium aridum]